MVKKLLPILCLLSMPLFGSLTGNYGVTGFDPHTRQPYQGEAVITERGDVAEVTWHLKPKGPVYTGTGIRRGDTLSVAFRNPTSNAEFGVVTYEIQDGETLSGKWVYNGRNKKGSETLRRL